MQVYKQQISSHADTFPIASALVKHLQMSGQANVAGFKSAFSVARMMEPTENIIEKCKGKNEESSCPSISTTMISMLPFSCRCADVREVFHSC